MRQFNMRLTELLVVLLTSLFFSTSQGQERLFDKNQIVWVKGQEDSAKHKFNGNPVISLEKDLKFLNKLKSNTTFFVVFKHDVPDNTDKLVSIKYGKQRIEVFTDGVRKNKKSVVDVPHKRNGQILTYVFNDSRVNLSSTNKIVLHKQQIPPEQFQLLEFLVVPEVLSNKEIRKIESYLSLKFGISLEREETYLGQNNDTIWDVSKSQDFLSRVTGIGLNMNAQFSQHSSKNSMGDGLEISFHEKSNKDVIANATEYMLWGDNNDTYNLESEVESSGFIKRTWKYKYSFSNEAVNDQPNNVDLKFDLTAENMNILLDVDNLYLAFSEHLEDFDLQSINQLQVYKAFQRDSMSLIYNDLKLNQEGYFKLLHIADLMLNVDENLTCNSFTEISAEIMGGIPPYHVEIEDLLTGGLEILQLEKPHFKKQFDIIGDFKITVKDALKNSLTELITTRESSLQVSGIPSQIDLLLNEHELLTPTVQISNLSVENFNPVWLHNGRKISESKNLWVSNEGSYSLQLGSDNCECNFPFTVNRLEKLDVALSSDVTLTTNPVNSGEDFILQFQLEDFANVNVAIVDVGGKLVYTERFNNVKNRVYKKSLAHNGVYFITVEYAQNKKTFKLIVK